MYCGFCGKQVADNHQYCPYCGAKIVKPSQGYQNQNYNQNQGYSQNYNQNQGYSQNYNQNGYYYGSTGGNTYYSTGYTQTTKYTVESVKDYNLISAYKEMFKKYAQFNGRSRRSEYWYATLMNGIIMMVPYIFLIFVIMGAIVSNEMTGASVGFVILLCLLLMLYCFAVMVPCIALGVRRLHDTGKSGLYMLFSLIPYVGSIILIVFMAMDSQPGPNQYGPNPKGM